MTPNPSDQLVKIKALMVARVVAISFFLGMVILYQMRVGQLPIVIPVSILIGTTYFLTILYALILSYTQRHMLFSYIQIVVDVFGVTGVIFITGGMDSPFPFLYILTIIVASIVLYRPGTYLVASVASILYGLLINLEFYEVIQPLRVFPGSGQPYPIGYVFFNVLLKISAFYAVAFLSSQLSESVRRVGEKLTQQSRDFTALRTFHQSVVKHMGNGFLAFDFQGRTVSSNPAAHSILGLSESEILDRPGSDVLQLPDLESLLQNSQSLQNYPKHFEWNFRHPEGTTVPLSMNVSNITDDEGNPTGIIGVFQNVTQLKEMEKKIAHSDRLAAIGQMSTGIAHEIRNPLASMSGSIQMLSKGLGPVLEDSQKRLMEIILRETDRLNSIITRFLQFAGPSSTRKEERPIHFLVKEVMSLLENSSDNAPRVRFHYELDNELVASVDPEQFKQLLWNLCMNSIQAMPDGGELRIAARNYSPDGNHSEKENGRELFSGTEYIQLSVSDDGDGISDECLKKIYDPFFTTKPKGTGLGLSMVYKIVENHGGQIDVESSPGKGTTFIVLLPVH